MQYRLGVGNNSSMVKQGISENTNILTSIIQTPVSARPPGQFVVLLN